LAVAGKDRGRVPCDREPGLFARGADRLSRRVLGACRAARLGAGRRYFSWRLVLAHDWTDASPGRVAASANAGYAARDRRRARGAASLSLCLAAVALSSALSRCDRTAADQSD